MATTSVACPNGSYTGVLTGGPGFIEALGPGKWRIVVNPTQPIAGYAAYHIIKYPGGQFHYSGTGNVWAMADSGTDPAHSEKLVVTAIV